VSGDEQKGILYLVATPIGNLEDVTLRALSVLAAVSLVAAEDTRHTRKLLARHGIRAELTSYREQNHARASRRILAVLGRGEDVALVSDAGTPGISDPGQQLVAGAIRRGFPVRPVPGPCAAVTALAASGLPTDRFVFVGFLPRKAGALRRTLGELAREPGSLVFYESPRRVGKTLGLMAEVLGEREAVLSRELTKIHETFDHGSLGELAGRYARGTRGEVTLVVAGAARRTAERRPEVSVLASALAEGRRLPAKEVARLLGTVSGLPRKDVYAMLVKPGEGQEPEDD
jgi:16S rRNA (cytidine1402-2'-O)-methyltransferase